MCTICWSEEVLFLFHIELVVVPRGLLRVRMVEDAA
jgi:hypothetical protein